MPLSSSGFLQLHCQYIQERVSVVCTSPISCLLKQRGNQPCRTFVRQSPSAAMGDARNAPLRNCHARRHLSPKRRLKGDDLAAIFTEREGGRGSHFARTGHQIRQPSLCRGEGRGRRRLELHPNSSLCQLCHAAVVHSLQNDSVFTPKCSLQTKSLLTLIYY